MAGLTDKGLVRKSNEDHVLTALGDEAPRWALGVAGVFDGVGGLPGGDEASSRAAQYLLKCLHSFERPWNEDDLKNVITEAMLSVHEHLMADGQELPHLKGMATTATVAIIAQKMPSVLAVGQVGDGSAFLVRGQQIERLTPTDARPAGPARWETAKRNLGAAFGNQISQALGHKRVVPHTGIYQIRRGDYIVLGTDGLFGEIGTDSIRQATTSPNLRLACQYLVDAANEAGGVDNISVAMIRVE